MGEAGRYEGGDGVIWGCLGAYLRGVQLLDVLAFDLPAVGQGSAMDVEVG
jgi:hypothetical protein